MPYFRQVPTGKAIRVARVLMPAVAANASTGKTNLTTFDDFRWRHVVGILTTNATKLVVIELDIAGRVFCDFDCGAWAPAQGMFHLDQWYPPGVIFSYNILTGAGAVVVNTDSFEVLYEADPDVTPPGP
jgi:hypothetical protein